MQEARTSSLRIFLENPLGLGCWALGGKNWGGQSERDTRAVLEQSYEEGIRHFDTARGYGVSEERMGPFLQDKRAKLFLASKVFPNRGPVFIRESLCRSLEALKTDYLDLLYLHWPVNEESIEEQIAVLEAARTEGLIRLIGVSNYSREQLIRAGEVDFLQTGYHALWRSDEKDLIPYCQEKEIRVIAYSPLGHGMLTGKFPQSPNFAKGDFRPNIIHFQKDNWPLVYRAIEELRMLAETSGRSLSHLALAWCLSRPGISGLVVGARNGAQATSNAHALEDPVPDEILAAITEVGERLMVQLPDAPNVFGKHIT